MASDAFFPFRDGLDVVVDAGASCVIQPGGSMRDQEVIDAANERGVAMVFTGVRHFVLILDPDRVRARLEGPGQAGLSASPVRCAASK